MATSVLRINSELANIAKHHGQLFNRSIAGQIEHWANIGRAVEASPEVSIGLLEELLTLVAGPDEAHTGENPAGTYTYRHTLKYEIARDLLNGRIASLSRQIAQERRKDTPDDTAIKKLKGQMLAIGDEISRLDVTNEVELDCVISSNRRLTERH